MNRTEVLEKLAPLMELGTRRIDHNPNTRVVVSSDEVALRPGGGARTLTIAKEGRKSLLQFTGIPVAVAEKLSDDTVGRSVTELLAHKHEYSVLTKQGEIVQFSPPTPERANVRPDRALAVVEKALGHVDYFRANVIGQNGAMVEVVGDKTEPDPGGATRGDLLQAGVFLKFSPLGVFEPQVQSYCMRLACTNGATSNTVIKQFQFTGGEGDGIYQWMRQSVKEAYRGFSRIVGQYRKMVEENVPPADRAMMLEALLKQAGIKGENAEAVRALALENPPRTSYDMHNLITYASSHFLEAPDQIQRAMLTTAAFSSEHDHARVCPTCRRTR